MAAGSMSNTTDDPAEAREWLAFKSSGIESLVVKGSSTRYVQLGPP
jgi:hypothetical protein